MKLNDKKLVDKLLDKWPNLKDLLQKLVRNKKNQIDLFFFFIYFEFSNSKSIFRHKIEFLSCLDVYIDFMNVIC